MIVRTRFNYDRNTVSKATGHYTNPDENDGKTQQHFKEESDINTIVNNFLKTGKLPENLRLPQYIDYEGVFDFQSAMNTMMQAEESFMTLPAQVRAQFDNSPQAFLQFCSDEANIPKMREMGLMKPLPVADTPPPVPPPVPPAARPEPGPSPT